MKTKVSKPYFSTSPQGARKIWSGDETILDADEREGSPMKTFSRDLESVMKERVTPTIDSALSMHQLGAHFMNAFYAILHYTVNQNKGSNDSQSFFSLLPTHLLRTQEQNLQVLYIHSITMQSISVYTSTL